MHVHAAARLVGHGLGHERRVHAVLHGDLFDNQLVGHDGVGHGQGIGEAQVDLMLGRAVLVVRVLHRDAHLLKREHGVAAQSDA